MLLPIYQHNFYAHNYYLNILRNATNNKSIIIVCVKLVKAKRQSD